MNVMDEDKSEFESDHEDDNQDIEDDLEPDQIWTHSLEKTHYYKVMTFCVHDLLQSIKQDDHFIIRNIAFANVQLCGTILAKTFKESKIFIEVDDGTGSIECSLDQEYFNNSIEDEQNDLESQDSVVSQGVMVVYSSLRNLDRVHIKDEEDLKIGDVVSLVGKLSEYNGTFTIFSEKVLKKNIDDFIIHLMDQEIFYKDLTV